MAYPMPSERDREGYSNPSQWPLYPFLPVKNLKGIKPGAFPRFGVMHAYACPTQEGKYVVILLSISEISAAALKNADIEQYDSIDSLMEAGWLVD